MKYLRVMILLAGLFLFAHAAQAQWEPTQRLTWTPGVSEYPDIAVAPMGYTHVVWHELVAANYEIYYKRSTDWGVTWSSSRRLTWTPASSLTPVVAVDSSGHPQVFWYEYASGSWEIYHKLSTDSGVTWSTSQRLTWNSGSSQGPVVAVGASGHIHLAWLDDTPGNSEIYYKKSTDAGATWTTSQRLTWTPGYSEAPDIAVDSSGNPHIFWKDSTPGNFEIYHKTSTDGGATWQASQRLTWTTYQSEYPAAAVDSSGHLHVVWQDPVPGNVEVFHKKSADGGTTWTSAQRLTWTSGASQNPDIAVYPGGYLYVVWQDNTAGNDEVYCKMSANDGTTWPVSQRLIWTSGESRFPKIAVDSSANLYVLWQDDTPGNTEIYYKRNKD